MHPIPGNPAACYSCAIMMHLNSAEGDDGLLAELKDAGVLDPGSIERIHEAMGRPESGSLTDFLLAGSDVIPEGPWLTWLIRRYGCHRFGRVAWRPGEAECGVALGAIGPNLPYRWATHGTLMVAVLRPDQLAVTASLLAPRRLLWAAGTLLELRNLRNSWVNARPAPGKATPQ